MKVEKNTLPDAPDENQDPSEAGPRTYESAQEAEKELSRRRITAEVPGRATARTGVEERLQRPLP